MRNLFSRIAFAVIVVLWISACGNGTSKQGKDQKQAESTSKVSDAHTAENALDYAGVYEGTLPAADCPGIKTQLSLYKDKTYKLVSEYIDRKDAVFTDSGAYVIQDNLVTLSVKDEEPTYYKAEEGKVVLLKKDKTPVTGDLADHYILKQVKTF